MLLRGLPSIDHFEFTPKKYLPSLVSTISFGRYGPVYSMIRLFLGIGSSAKNPNPVLLRFIAYFQRLGFIFLTHCSKFTTSPELAFSLTDFKRGTATTTEPSAVAPDSKVDLPRNYNWANTRLDLWHPALPRSVL